MTGRRHQGIKKNNYDLQGFEPQIILCRAAVLPTVPQPLLLESAKSRLYRGWIGLTLTLPLTGKSIGLDRSVENGIVINIDRPGEIIINIDRFSDNIFELTLTLPLTGKKH